MLFRLHNTRFFLIQKKKKDEKFFDTAALFDYFLRVQSMFMTFKCFYREKKEVY